MFMRRVLFGGVAALVLAANTGCHRVHSFLCYCWNEVSPCHWGCAPLGYCGGGHCEPCDQFGNWVGYPGYTGGHGPGIYGNAPFGPGPYLSKSTPSSPSEEMIVGESHAAPSAGEVVYETEPQVVDDRVVGEAPRVASRPVRSSRSAPTPATRAVPSQASEPRMAEQPTEWRSRAQRMPSGRQYRGASYSRYR